MTADFSHFKKLRVSAKSTAEYAFTGLEGTPKMIVRPAAEENPPYFEAVGKQTAKALRRVKAGAAARLMKENRKLDRDLYPQYVIADWSGVLDANGAEVPYNQSDCAEFLRQLPAYMFDELRAFCGDVTNFLPEEEEDEPEEEDLEALGED